MGTYDFDGAKYKKASRGQKEWGRDLISRLALRGDERILDLGCGDGVLTMQLADMVPDGYVLGVDASQGMLQAAQSGTRPNLAFRRLDIDALDYEDAFDLVFSNAALHWVHDHERLLAASRRALRDGGRIAWNFAAHGTCRSFFAVVRDVMQDDRFSRYFREFAWPFYMPTKEAYEHTVADAGFATYSVAQEQRDRLFSDAGEMIAWIDQPSIVPFLAAVPSDGRAGFREAVVERMIARTQQPDGRCFETFRRLRVMAEK